MSNKQKIPWKKQCRRTKCGLKKQDNFPFCSKTCGLGDKFKIPYKKCKLKGCKLPNRIEWKNGTPDAERYKESNLNIHPTCNRSHAEQWLHDERNKTWYEKAKSKASNYLDGGVDWCMEFFDAVFEDPSPKTSEVVDMEWETVHGNQVHGGNKKHAKKRAKKKWGCPNCTFDNSMDVVMCNQCGTHRNAKTEKPRNLIRSQSYEKPVPGPPESAYPTLPQFQRNHSEHHSAHGDDEALPDKPITQDFSETKHPYSEHSAASGDNSGLEIDFDNLRSRPVNTDEAIAALLNFTLQHRKDFTEKEVALKIKNQVDWYNSLTCKISFVEYFFQIILSAEEVNKLKEADKKRKEAKMNSFSPGDPDDTLPDEVQYSVHGTFPGSGGRGHKAPKFQKRGQSYSSSFRQTGPIDFYERDEAYYEFTNFYESPITIDGDIWPTTEHYFQAMKFNQQDQHCKAYWDTHSGRYHRPHREIQAEIQRTRTPREVFTLCNGRNGTFKACINPDWHTGGERSMKIEYMKRALQQKFTQHPKLRKMLVDTGNRDIYEHTTNDSYWADGGKHGKGENMLGRLLQELRTDLQGGRL